MAQRKRAGLITRRTSDRNRLLLFPFAVLFFAEALRSVKRSRYEGSSAMAKFLCDLKQRVLNCGVSKGGREPSVTLGIEKACKVGEECFHAT